ncbi:hypothetical protein Bbelb_130330 [Branchiostoma belcheri]|nr:hypothetical protein Bbelb_130330 [Branchiostoma belcheri]
MDRKVVVQVSQFCTLYWDCIKGCTAPSSCGYSTVRKSTLAQHMTTHTGEKRYKCDQCDYSTAKKLTLDRHLATRVDCPQLSHVWDCILAAKAPPTLALNSGELQNSSQKL